MRTPLNVLSGLLVTTLITGLISVGAVAQPAHIPEAPRQDSLPADQILTRLETWLPGTYTNAAQLTGHENDEGAFALTTIIKPLTNPALGDNLYYLEEFRGDDPKAIVRIRIYQFTEIDGLVHLRLLNPTDTDGLQGDHGTLAKAAQLTHADISPDRDACLLYLSTYNDDLVARMTSRACDVQDTWIDYELIIDDSGTWTCFARRQKSDDRLTWLQMPSFPCVRQTRTP